MDIKTAIMVVLGLGSVVIVVRIAYLQQLPRKVKNAFAWLGIGLIVVGLLLSAGVLP